MHGRLAVNACSPFVREELTRDRPPEEVGGRCEGEAAGGGGEEGDQRRRLRALHEHARVCLQPAALLPATVLRRRGVRARRGLLRAAAGRTGRHGSVGGNGR